MQFDDGSPDVAPGEDITVDTSSGHVDLGAATYDSDHDGVADSVIVADGDLSIVVTDHDHDGTADSMKAYDAQGHEVDPKTGQPVDPSASTHPDGHADPVSAPAGSTDPGHPGDPGQPADPGTGPSGDHSGQHAGGITVQGADGAPVSVGDPTVDMDKDGRPDTAVVKHSDGSVTGYTDRDGDGTADQITQVGADGKVVIAVADDHDGWKVVATGHLDANGTLVEDPQPEPGAHVNPPDGTEQPPAHPTGSDTPEPGADPGSQPADPGQPAHPGTAPAGDITVSKDGQDYDLGRPTADMDGDGKPDTVVSKQADGTVVGYTDTDGNGTADRITQISPDGSVVIAEPDGSGGWHQVGSGHMGPDGQFVPDSGQGTAAPVGG